MTFKLYTVSAVINEFEMVWMEMFVDSLRHLVQTLGKLRKPARHLSKDACSSGRDISLGPIKY